MGLGPGSAGEEPERGSTPSPRIGGLVDWTIVDSTSTMILPLAILLGAILGARPSVPPAGGSAKKPVPEALRTAPAEPRLRLAWFNALDRSFSLEVGAGPVEIALHAPDGTLLTLIHRGPIAPREVLRVTEDLPAGLYLLRLRQGNRHTIERVTLF